jgi:formylglycine-generating enzyme required for sulfatase activity/tRNA A-37 threonylcarbamoyl transferase component Bud32
MPSVRPSLPERLGRYRILGKLGEGGTATVYLAEDECMGRRVALKVPRLSSADSHRLARLLREARVAATFNHPNICPVFNVEEVDGQTFLVLPYIEGTPLSKVVAGTGPWDPGQAAGLVAIIARTLDMLHRQGIVHRDLKPQNIMIRPDGLPVLMDLGLARSFTTVSRELTADGTPLGTPAYMSPEQVAGGGANLGPATDVYGLGVILYELLTGHIPFEGDVLAIFGQILHSPPRPPSHHRPDLDEEIDALCLTALAKNSQDRFPAGGAFADALEDYARRSVAPAVPTAPPEATAAIEERDLPTPENLIDCPLCGQALMLPPALAGQEVHCPHCQSLFQVRPLAANASSVETDARHSLGTVDEATRVPSGRPTPTQRPIPLWLIGLGVLLLNLVLLALVALVVRRGRTHEASGDPPSPDQERPEEPRPPGTTGPLRVMTSSVGMRLVLIPAGRFMMGSPAREVARKDDEQAHEVTLTRPFYLGAYEVTQKQYAKIMGTNPSYFSSSGPEAATLPPMDRDRLPVERITWENAAEFCRKLSELPAEKAAGRSYRLPTEAEWEYACRAGGDPASPFSTGGFLTSPQANFERDLGRTVPVGSYPPNAFGLHDMHGNVSEWCADWYTANLAQSPSRDPRGPETGTQRVLRGGSWFDSEPACRSAARVSDLPIRQFRTVGFRVACDLPKKTP